MKVLWVDDIAVLEYLSANFSVDAALRLAHDVDCCAEALKLITILIDLLVKILVLKTIENLPD